MAQIDYKKVYVMVPQSWIVDCLKMYKISNKVKKINNGNYQILDRGINGRERKTFADVKI